MGVRLGADTPQACAESNARRMRRWAGNAKRGVVASTLPDEASNAQRSEAKPHQEQATPRIVVSRCMATRALPKPGSVAL